MSECYKIIGRTPELQEIIDRDYKPEISHPPEAIEEISKPVYDKYSPKKIGYIKLHRCKLCGMVILDGDCGVVKC